MNSIVEIYKSQESANVGDKVNWLGCAPTSPEAPVAPNIDYMVAGNPDTSLTLAPFIHLHGQSNGPTIAHL